MQLSLPRRTRTLGRTALWGQPAAQPVGSREGQAV